MSPACGGGDERVEDAVPPPGEIRARIAAYLTGPEIGLEDHDAALAYLADHPEVAAARVARPRREDDGMGRFAPAPAEVLALADEVLVEEEATGYLRATLPEGEVRLRGLAVRLAREVRRLLGKADR